MFCTPVVLTPYSYRAYTIFQSKTQNSTVVRFSPSKKYTYSVKIIDPSRKSDYSIQKLSYSTRFSTAEDVRATLNSITGNEVERFGYIEPGHGVKGRQQWITSDGDIEEMYHCYKSRRDVLLWFYDPAIPCDGKRKRQRQHSGEESGIQPLSKSRKCASVIPEVEKIVKRLKEKHGSMYTVEQLNCWAHLLHMEKHGSDDSPPDLPFFRRVKRAACDPVQQQPPSSSASTTQSAVNSPSKLLGMRGQCIEQLDKWYSLLERGGIDHVQYQELQKKIIEDINNWK